MAEPGSGREALARIDAALAARPERDGVALKAAVQALAAFRDRVAARHHAEGGARHRPTLDHVNAVISVVLAAEFPVGETPWAELEGARRWLDAALRADEAPGPAQ